MKKNESPAMNAIDIEAAWETFSQKAKDEPVHERWTRPEEEKAPLSEAVERLSIPETLSSDPGMPSLTAPQPTVYSETRANRMEQTRSRLKKWGITAAAAVVAGTMVFTPMGAKALADVFGTFRIQHLQTVSISTGDLDRLQRSLRQGTLQAESFDLSQYGKVEQEGGGSIRRIPAAEAERESGYKLKALPGQTGGDRLVEYQPALKLTFRLHTDPINRLLAQLGGKSKLPASADGKPITLEIPAMVRTAGSDANMAQTKQLMQLASPVLNVPDGVDVEQVRRAVLDLPLLPPDVKAKIEGIEDWKHTLPIPVIGDIARQVRINGNEALISDHGGEKAAVWLDNGRIYLLTGTPSDYPTDEAILLEAGEIAKQ